MYRLLGVVCLVACGRGDFQTPKYGFIVVHSQSGDLLSGEEIDGRFDAFRDQIGDHSERDWPDYIVRFWDDGTLTLPDSNGKPMEVGGEFWSDSEMIEVAWASSTHPFECDGAGLTHELAHYWQWVVNDFIDYDHKQEIIWLGVFNADKEVGCIK